MKAQKKNIPLWLLIVICMAIIALVGFLLIRFFGDEPWVTTLGYLVAASAIAIGGCVAYHQLRIIQRTERASVLTNLDCSWMGTELEKSRIAFLKLKNEFKNISNQGKRKANINDKLREIRDKDQVEYRQLVGMINFFETIGYFSRVGYISPNDAIELYGPAIRDNDETFRSHILELQDEYKDKEVYANFLWIADIAKQK
jgi:hypothetical protein